MRLHVILHWAGRLRLDWSKVCRPGEWRTALIAGPEVSGSLAVEDRALLDEVIETNDFSPECIAGLVTKLVELLAPGKRDELRLATTDEGLVYLVATLRDRFDAPGQDAFEARAFTNKLEMKRRAAPSGIAQPKHEQFDFESYRRDAAEYLDSVVSRLGCDLVSKPTNLSGALGVVHMRSFAELAHWASEADKRYAPGARYTIEVDEFVDGVLYHVDTVVQGGKPLVAIVGEYTCPNAEFLEGRVLGSIPLDGQGECYQVCADASRRILSAMSASDGVYHLELFRRRPTGEPVFLEVAARPPGALVPELYRKCYRIDLTAAAILLQLGLTLELPPDRAGVPDQVGHAVWAFFPAVAGTVVELQEPQVHGRGRVTWRCRVGDQLRPARSLSDWIGHIFIHESDAGAAKEDFMWLRDTCQPVTVA